MEEKHSDVEPAGVEAEAEGTMAPMAQVPYVADGPVGRDGRGRAHSGPVSKGVSHGILGEEA